VADETSAHGAAEAAEAGEVASGEAAAGETALVSATMTAAKAVPNLASIGPLSRSRTFLEV
jgi:hypothetical protein